MQPKKYALPMLLAFLLFTGAMITINIVTYEYKIADCVKVRTKIESVFGGTEESARHACIQMQPGS